LEYKNKIVATREIERKKGSGGTPYKRKRKEK